MPVIGIADGLPKYDERRVITEEDANIAKWNTQFLVHGALTAKFPSDFPNDKDITVYVETINSSAAVSITAADGASTVVAAVVNPPFGDAHAPLRFDGGLLVTGSAPVTIKGFYIKRK